MKLLHNCYEIASRMFSEHLHHIFFGFLLLELQWNKYTVNQYYMNRLNKLSKYTTQLILLFLLDYTLVFLCSLMTCNSTTGEIFAY